MKRSQSTNLRITRQRGQAGLIGLLVVILILAILGGILYPKLAGRNEGPGSTGSGPPTPIDRANDAACLEYMQQVTQAATMYRSEHNHPARDLESLKPYGLTEDMIDAPCQYGLPKRVQAQVPANGGQPTPAYESYPQPQNTYTNGAPQAPPAPAQPQQPAGTTGVIGQPGLHVPTTDPSAGAMGAATGQ